MSERVRIHALHCGGEHGDMAVFDPFHPEIGRQVVIPYFAYLVEHPLGKVLFDTGAHPDLIDDPAKRLGPAAEAFEVMLKPEDIVTSRLEAIGVAPEEVEHVALSHLHYDHAGGIELFPDAAFYVQERELQFAHWPPVYQRDMYVRADFDHDVDWQELSGEYDFFGDGRVTLFPTPGHSAGHQSMLVRLEGGSVILVADAAYTRRNLDLQVLPALVWNPDAMVASWRRIEALRRREDAELIFTHDLDWETRTKVAPAACYE